MKNLNKVAILSGLFIATGLIATTNAAPMCSSCDGYYYIAVSETNNGGFVDYQYNDIGAFASEESCQSAVQNDYGNGDAWLPFSGSPICKWRYGENAGVYEDIINDWNTVANPDNPGVIADEEVVKEIAELREEYRLKRYEAQLHSLITDPNNDEDEDDKTKRDGTEAVE